MKPRAILRGVVITAASLVTAYGVYVGVTWLGYDRRHCAKKEEADQLLDRFMSEYEVVERHSIFVRAPAEVTLAAAYEMDFDESRIVGMILKGRELLMHGQPAGNELPRGLLAKTKALGWGVLAEAPGREIVMGAVTQPWVANAKFRNIGT
jgi:hypothetical protein